LQPIEHPCDVVYIGLGRPPRSIVIVWRFVLGTLAFDFVGTHVEALREVVGGHTQFLTDTCS
jgi:hypothetical protein